jgi:hypothetical protein
VSQASEHRDKKFGAEEAETFFEKMRLYEYRKSENLKQLEREAKQECTHSPRVNERSKELAVRAREKSLYSQLERRLSERNSSLGRQEEV